MLEKAIEIEGLLRIIRDGKPLPETYILLHKKVAELAEQTEGLEEPETERPLEREAPHADFVMAAPEPAALPAPEVVFTVASTSDAGSGMAQEDLSLIEEDDILLSFDDSTEFPVSIATAEETDNMETEDTNETAVSEEGYSAETIDKIPETIIDVSLQQDTVAEESAEDSTEQTSTETSETTLEAETPIMPDDSASAAPQQRQAKKLRAAFSLNDRFLYARELFNGNMKMFDSTLDFLEGIEDYSIIEDYFYSELEWNPEDTNVASFMEILRPHFRE